MTATEPAQVRAKRRSVFTRLAGFAQRHHWTALILWVLVLAGITLTSQAVGDDYSNDFNLPGTQSGQLMDLLEEKGAQGADSATVVLRDENGWDTESDAIDDMVAELGQLDSVASVEPPNPEQGGVSEDGTTAMVSVAYDGPSEAVSTADQEAIMDTAKEHATGDLQVEVAGEGIREVAASEEGGGAEFAGMLAALIILVFLFGSLLAATLPLITAIFAVGSTVGVVVLASHISLVPDYTPPILMLVGLGVGIDYALLVFSRYRSELLHGADRPQATAIALDTAGRSVMFAGISVIIALAGLYILGVSALEGIVLGVVLTVAATMLASLTLLPALLTIFGKRLEKSIRKHAAKKKHEHGDGWRKLGGAVQRTPWPALLIGVIAMGALAVPALSMNLGLADAGNDPEESTTRAAYDLISENWGPGANGPLMLVTEGSEAEAQAAYDQVDGYPGVAEVVPPQPIADGVQLSMVFPETGPQDQETSQLVKDLRDDLGEPYLIGGSTAANVDFSAAIADRFPIFLGVVVLVSFILLVIVFGSIPIAIKAGLLNLLTIGAALGAMKLVFQDGMFGVTPGPIEAFLPVMIFAIVFGLSMDYEVFLVSRMHEEWHRTGDAQLAVRDGLAHTGGVITAAAAIMIVVFGFFVLSPDRMLQQMGFGMAVAVFLDALVVRCLIVPAVMRLMGEKAWWAPGWLRRILPKVRVE